LIDQDGQASSATEQMPLAVAQPPVSADRAAVVVGGDQERKRSVEGVVQIFTGGACKGNQGPGGWGAVLRYGRHEKTICGGEPGDTTHNRMELLAAIMALEALTRPSADSKYLRDGISEWLARWKRNGWKNTRVSHFS
jgi:ribonuclease HI